MVEGDPAGRGCSAAVVRVWNNPNDHNSKAVELCGDSLTNKSKEILSSDNVLRLSFYGAQKSVGAAGFSAVWTEIALPVETSGLANNIGQNHTELLGICPENIGFKQHRTTQTSAGETGQVLVQPPQFQCKINKFCISSQLRCNGIANCGFGDDSDEKNCVKQIKLNIVDLVGGFTGLVMLSLFTLGVVGLSLILLITWYKRISGCGVKQVQDTPDNKNNNCPHLLYNLHYPSPNPPNGHFADPISGLVLPFENNFNPSEDSEVSPESQHRMMSLSLGGGKQSKQQWVPPSRANINDTDVAGMLLDDDAARCGLERGQSPSTDDTPIPPPPPPPHHHSNHHLHHAHHTPTQNSHLVQSRSNHSSLEHSLQFNTIAPEPSIMMMMNVAGSSQSIDRFSSFRPPPIGPPPPSTSGFISASGAPLPTFAFANTANMPMFHTLPHQFHPTPSAAAAAHVEHPSYPSNETHFATLQRYNPKTFHKGSSIDVTSNYHISNVDHGPDVLEDDDAELSLRLGTSTSSGISHHLNYKLVAAAAAAANPNNGSILGGLPTFHGTSIRSNNVDELYNNDNGPGTGSSADENGIDGPIHARQCLNHENQSLILD